MAQAPALDDATLCLVDFAAAIATGHDGLLRRSAERAVAQIVRQCDRLDQVLVEPQRARHGPRDLRDLQGVGQARAVVIAFVIDEDLRLVFQPPERGAVNDAVAIALIGGPVGVFGLVVRAPAGLGRPAGERRQLVGFEVLGVRSRAHGHDP